MCTHFSTQNYRHLRRFYLTAGLVLLVLGLMLPTAARAVTADVVAMDQVLVYNRMAAFNPAGMIFALARDVFPKNTPTADQTRAPTQGRTPDPTVAMVGRTQDRRPSRSAAWCRCVVPPPAAPG